MTTSNGFYLNKAQGKMFGVCAGLADYLGVDALWVRIGVVALTLLGHGVTIPLYLAIAFLASRRVSEPASTERDDSLMLERYHRRRQRSSRLREDISDMDRRLADMERHYTGGNSQLASEIERLR